MKQLMDYMAIGAHPDDVELHAGGTLVKMTSEGKKGVIVDMTRADAATRGTPELRLQEAAKAGRILGIAERINLGLPDSQLQVNPETILKVVKVIRQYRPKIILTHSQDDYHPDHVATCEIVKRAWYMSGLKRVLPEYEAYRPKRLFHFIGAVSLQPRFCIDITPFFEVKMKAILSFASQFYSHEFENYEGKTDLSSPEFLDFIRIRNRHYGTLIRTEYAEGFWCREIAEVSDITNLGERAY